MSLKVHRAEPPSLHSIFTRSLPLPSPHSLSLSLRYGTRERWKGKIMERLSWALMPARGVPPRLAAPSEGDR